MALGEWFVSAATLPGARRVGRSAVWWVGGSDRAMGTRCQHIKGVGRKADGGASENDERGGSVFPLSWGEGGGVIAAWRL